MTDNEGWYYYQRISAATGQIRRWIGRPGVPKKSSKDKEPFVMTYQSAHIDIARTWELQGFDLRVYIFLLGIMSKNNWLRLEPGEVAEMMSTEATEDEKAHEVQRTAVSRSLRHLVEHEILIKGEYHNYRLNPGVGWKGYMKEQDEAEAECIEGNLNLKRSPKDA